LEALQTARKIRCKSDANQIIFARYDVALERWLVQVSTNLLKRVRESTEVGASGKQKVVLVLSFVALAAIVAGVLVWSGALR
jgi:hypothetical protein